MHNEQYVVSIDIMLGTAGRGSVDLDTGRQCQCHSCHVPGETLRHKCMHAVTMQVL